MISLNFDRKVYLDMDILLQPYSKPTCELKGTGTAASWSLCVAGAILWCSEDRALQDYTLL